tara:strand:- start:15606 stop:16331 length:726 start_codon:yes stop_codon:yes gene_type:complete
MSEKYTANEWATMYGGHTVEKKKKYSFIRDEITEARYIRTGSDALGRDMTDVAESYFEQLLMLQQMRFENPAFAKKYAKDTLKFMNFSGIKPGGTDLHNLASIINNPNKYKGVTSSGSVNFNEIQFKRYLRDIASGRDNMAMDRSFLIKTQKDLGINSSFLKQARRVSADYGRTGQGERAGLSARMVNSQRVDGKFRSDISRQYMGTIKNKKLIPQDKKLPLWAKAAAGFATGVAIGKMID